MSQNQSSEQTSMPKKPNPGSSEALAMGCKCPVLDNARGKGYMGVAGMFVYSFNCPVHSVHEKAVA